MSQNSLRTREPQSQSQTSSQSPRELDTPREPITEDGYDSITETETEDDPYLETKDFEALQLQVAQPIATATRNFSSLELRASQDSQVLCWNSGLESMAPEATSDDDFASLDDMVT